MLLIFIALSRATNTHSKLQQAVVVSAFTTYNHHHIHPLRQAC